jgi:hypothetical protein
MTRFSRLMVVSVMTAGLAACGGSAKLGGGKQGAAQAAFLASQPAGRGGKTEQALLDRALASGATTGLTLTADCARSGKATLVLESFNFGAQELTFNYAVTYDACNEDGRNEYNGTMATTMKYAAVNYTSASFSIAMKGRLTIEGEISDFIDTDVRLTMDFSATSTRSGTIKLVTDGAIKTSEGNYAYTHETLSLTVGKLPQA